MTPPATPLERPIDALQTALITAQAVDLASHDLSDESRRLVETVKRAGLCAHDLRADGDQ